MSIWVDSGVHHNSYDLDGKTVAEIRAAVKGLSSIHDDAVPYVDGNVVSATRVIETDETVEFLKAAGQKGFRHNLN